jgi:hypothetical protein
MLSIFQEDDPDHTYSPCVMGGIRVSTPTQDSHVATYNLSQMKSAYPDQFFTIEDAPDAGSGSVVVIWIPPLFAGNLVAYNFTRSMFNAGNWFSAP